MVLYETLTGVRPFDGENKIATLSAILHKNPKPISEVAPGLPPELVRLVDRCIRKDRERRIQHMADVKVTLEDVREQSETGNQVAPSSLLKTTRRTRVAFTLIALAAAAIAAAAAVAVWVTPRETVPSRDPILRRLTADAGLSTDPTVSSDGRLVAFASDRAGEGNLDIWVMHVAGGSRVRLTNHNADDSQPSFAPDGSQIAFRSGREPAGIYVVPTFGGETRLIAPGGFRPQFSPDGKFLLYWDNATGNYIPARSYVLPAAGGVPRQIRNDFARVGHPVWAPDGNHILFEGARKLDLNIREQYDWWVTPVQGGTPIATGALRNFREQGMSAGVPGVWLPGRVLHSGSYTADTANIMEVPISRDFQTAQPRRLTAGTTIDVMPSAAGDN